MSDEEMDDLGEKLEEQRVQARQQLKQQMEAYYATQKSSASIPISQYLPISQYQWITQPFAPIFQYIQEEQNRSPQSLPESEEETPEEKQKRLFPVGSHSSPAHIVEAINELYNMIKDLYEFEEDEEE